MRRVAGFMGLVHGALLVGGCTLQGGAQTSTMPSGGEIPDEGDGGGGEGGGGEMIEAGCSFNGHQLRGEVGQEFDVSCPANCDSGATWGSDIYTFDSGICRAGIHAGAISSAGGVVQVRIEPGRPAYRGSMRNGITSHDYGQYPKSYAVLNAGEGGGPVAAGDPGGDPGPVDDGGGSEVIEAGCSYNGTQIVGEIGTSVVVNCPPGCASQGGLWGSGPYTLDSGVCRAAVHAGVLDDGGGNVRVTVEPGRPAYRGSTRNGVQGHDYGKYPKSFRVGPP